MKNMKLLLTENVENLGIVGEVVTVKLGYARNYLLPRGLGADPTEGNIKRLAARRAQVEQEIREHRAQLEVMFEKLADVEITIMRSSNEQGVLFGGVSQHDIAETLREEGFNIDDRAVRIGEQIKRLDTYSIPIVLGMDLATEIKLWVVSDKPKDDLEVEEQEDAAEEALAENVDPTE